MSINIIASVDKNNCIGCENDLLYDIIPDKKYFSQITKGEYYKKNKFNIVVMGKNTWESIPSNYKPLKDRINIIISSSLYNRHYILYDNVFIFKTFNDFYENISFSGYTGNIINFYNFNINEIFIIGGSQVYKNIIDNYNINKIYLTQITDNNKKIKDLINPVYFPDINFQNFTLIDSYEINTGNYTTKYFDQSENIICNFSIFQSNSYIFTD